MPHTYDRILSTALGHPWALTRPMLSVVASVLARHISHGITGVAAEAPEFVRRPAASEPPSGTGVAVIPIHGVIAPRMNLFSEMSGGATFEQATASLRAAMADRAVTSIVLDWDSPGGSCAGASEFASELLAAREHKRIISHAHYEMCSAAYLAGACATEMVASPSALVGSIGVYWMHEDLSAALAEAGIKITYISAGQFKVDGNETEPLSDSARAHMTAIVESYYDAFIGHVATGRGITADHIRSGYGQGTVVTAAEALRLGMIDRIEPFDQTLARALAIPAQRSSMAAARVRTVNEVEQALLALSF